MKTTIIKIGNSRGVRIPKSLLVLSGLSGEVELKVEKGEIKILASSDRLGSISETALISEKVLGRDWNRPEEDEAWANL